MKYSIQAYFWGFTVYISLTFFPKINRSEKLLFLGISATEFKVEILKK